VGVWAGFARPNTHTFTHNCVTSTSITRQNYTFFGRKWQVDPVSVQMLGRNIRVFSFIRSSFVNGFPPKFPDKFTLPQVYNLRVGFDSVRTYAVGRRRGYLGGLCPPKYPQFHPQLRNFYRYNKGLCEKESSQCISIQVQVVSSYRCCWAFCSASRSFCACFGAG